jgi:hypothetical protein
LSYTRLCIKICPFDPALTVFAQSPEPHPYTQPKRTAKVGEKALKPKVESKKLHFLSRKLKAESKKLILG